MTCMTDRTPSSRSSLLAGSERSAAPGAEVLGPVDPAEQLTVTLVLRRRGELPVLEGGQRLTPGELARAAGADPADLTVVADVLHSYGVDVDAQDAVATRLVRATARRQGC